MVGSSMRIQATVQERTMTPRVDFSPFVITKKIDKSTPILMQAGSK
jgi:type VI protein secretion system component Hcp